MVYIIIGGSRAGKTQVTINSFIGNSEIIEKRDLIPYSETENYILLGKYKRTERRKGTDLVSRKDIPKFYEQILRLKDKGKDIVIEGDKITSDTLFGQLYEGKIDCKLYFVKCSAETSIRRCREHNDNFTESNLKALITKCKNRFNKWKTVFDGEIIDTDKKVDFTKISIKDAYRPETLKVEGLKNNFCIFIISNGRPDKQKTYECLKRNKCTFPIYIVCDDLDSRLMEYQEKYGDKVIVFDKKEVAKTVDTITNSKNLQSLLFARKKCRDIAKQLGYKYYLILDDDLEDFGIRYEEKGKLKYKRINDLDFMFNITLDLLEKEKIYGISYPNLHFYMGGLKNEKYQAGLYPGFYCAMFLKTEYEIDFKGIINEDLNATIEHNEKGQPLFLLMGFCCSTCQRGTNKGGMQETYLDSGEYMKAFYSLIPNPSRIVIKKDFKEKRLRFGDFPKILSSRWKK